MSPNDADGMANSVDPDQTAPVCTVCPGLSVRKLRNITVCIVYGHRKQLKQFPVLQVSKKRDVYCM